MLFFNIKAFQGATPKLSDRLLPDSAATVAKNCKTGTGTLRPVHGMLQEQTPSKVGTKKTIFFYEDQYWLHWLEDVDVVKGPIAGDTSGRLYWTGEGAPKVSNAVLITGGGGSEYPNNAYTLGIPAPTIPPTVAVAGGSVDASQAESRAYVFTYVSEWGEEGPPSPASSIIAVEPSQSVDLSGLPVAPAGAYNITHKRLYRTATGTTGTEFMYVADIPVGTADYNDAVATSDLGETIPSTYWDPPPSDLHSLKLHPAGFMVGISGKDICFSEQYLPHAWPDSYKVPIDHQPIGLGVFGTSILVLTDNTPYALTGVEPGFMTKERLEINQACVSKRGIVDIGNATAYPSPDGLMIVGSGIAKNATQDLLTREQWQELVPESMVAGKHDGSYYGFADGGSIVTNFSEVLTTDVAPDAVHVDTVRDKLYLMVADDILAWDADQANPLQATWKSGIHVTPEPVVGPGIAQVRALEYPLTFRLYADGALQHTENVTSNEPFRIAGGYRAEEYQVEIIGDKEILSVTVATTMQELRSARHS